MMYEDNYIDPVGIEVYESVKKPELSDFVEPVVNGDGGHSSGQGMPPSPRKSKKKGKGRFVFITTMTVMSHDNLFQPKTQVRAFQSYYDAKEEHINNIQNVMDKIDGEDEKQFFFNKYGKGNSNFIYHFDILGESEYILTLTSTKVKPRTQLSIHK